MKNTLKQLGNLKKEAVKSIIPEYDEEHREIISMFVREDSNFLSAYSGPNGAVIAGDVAEFLDNAVKPMALRDDLHLVITSSQIDDEEKEIYRKAIKNYYRGEVIDSDKRLHRNGLASLWMVIAGFVIIAAAVTLKLLGIGEVLVEAVDIAGWVFLWESVHLFFIERPKLKYEQLRACALYNAKVSYKNPEECKAAKV